MSIGFTILSMSQQIPMKFLRLYSSQITIQNILFSLLIKLNLLSILLLSLITQSIQPFNHRLKALPSQIRLPQSHHNRSNIILSEDSGPLHALVFKIKIIRHNLTQNLKSTRAFVVNVLDFCVKKFLDQVERKIRGYHLKLNLRLHLREILTIVLVRIECQFTLLPKILHISCLRLLNQPQLKQKSHKSHFTENTVFHLNTSFLNG